jgi:hypothetical protein
MAGIIGPRREGVTRVRIATGPAGP